MRRCVAPMRSTGHLVRPQVHAEPSYATAPDDAPVALTASSLLPQGCRTPRHRHKAVHPVALQQPQPTTRPQPTPLQSHPNPHPHPRAPTSSLLPHRYIDAATRPYTTAAQLVMNPHAGVDMTSPLSSALQHTHKSTVPLRTLLTSNAVSPDTLAANVMLSATRSAGVGLRLPYPYGLPGEYDGGGGEA